MLEIVNQLDGFDSRGNIKVLMATNRPDTLDPALLRPGRLDRKVQSPSFCPCHRYLAHNCWAPIKPHGRHLLSPKPEPLHLAVT